MAKRGKRDKKPVEQYDHKGKTRVNNPPVGLVTHETDRDAGKKEYSYDPHLDPCLVWAGKDEHSTFEASTVSLHVHERIDPKTIIEAARRKDAHQQFQTSLFEWEEENPPLRDAIEFYKHRHNWTNRLVAGDSLLVMNSLLEKEGMAGKIQMTYIDPPYGIRYGSNFQPFVNRRDVKDRKDDDLTAEPEMIKAFRDTWELGIHSYLGYLRDRLLLSRELLSNSGSIFVQIGDENVHLIRNLMADHLVWYAKDKKLIKYHHLYLPTIPRPSARWTGVELADGSRRNINSEEKKDISKLPEGARIFHTVSLLAPSYSEKSVFDFEFEGDLYSPPKGSCWITTKKKMEILAKMNRLVVESTIPRYVMYYDDFPYSKVTNPWTDTAPAQRKIFVVQTNENVIARCILMTTDPGDLIMDPTCGSGTTAFVSEKWGRRWITCDTSRVAIALAKQRLMTASYDYYKLAHPSEGVSSGFEYIAVEHTTLRSIVNDEPPAIEVLYNRPILDKGYTRISGPFTLEAVPSPTVESLDEIKGDSPADLSVARSRGTLRQNDWKDELLLGGIRGKRRQRIEFSRLETLPGTRWLHVDGETIESQPKRVVVSFGPEHAPLEQRQVELAIEEEQSLVPRPAVVVFAAFQFDPEAAKDIDQTSWPGVTLLKVQMNADLLTEDLRKKQSSSESFWLVGQPDVVVTKVGEGSCQVEILGFDYYNTRTGVIESGEADKIAMWMLDTDYDGRSLYPRQVFFPMAGKNEGWGRLAKTLKAEIDAELIEAYRGTVSLPFEIGEHKRIAVKIVDDRGIESLKIVEVD
ncbi:MAG: DNA methyltransferase [Candidatus Thorarchaeota archaeon]|jgi:adenine-specific DNA-methyltransferase